MTVQTVRKAIASAVFGAGLVIASSAWGATVTECIADVAIVKSDIAAATTFANAADQTNLALKADSAIQKLDKGKFADAAAVLADMGNKVTTLSTAAKPKLGTADATLILGALNTAQTCVTQLMTQ